MRRYALKITTVLISGILALCVLAAVVDERSARNITVEPQLVSIPSVAEPDTVRIPTMVFTEEELDERIDRIREENVIRALARASYVARYDVQSETDNAYYLACIICRECGAENEEIMLLVGNVVLNRVESESFPNSIYGVLTQPGQYDGVWEHGISFPDWATYDMRQACYAAAYRLLSGERFCPSNVVYQAEFQQGSGVYAYYPGFYFCYE